MSGYIYQRPDTKKFYIAFQDQNRRWIREKIGANKADAQKALIIRQSEVIQNKFNFAETKPKTILFEKWADEFKSILSDRREQNRLKPLTDYFSGKLLNKISLWDMQLFKTQRAAKVSELETNKEMKLLKRLMQAAAGDGYKNQIADCKLPIFKNADKGRIRVLNYEEEKLMLESALKLGKIAIYNFLIIGLHTSNRPSEIFGLKFDAIDFNKNQLTVYQPKVKKYKSIPLNDSLRQLLLNLSANRKGDYILTNNNKPFHNSYFNKLWRIVRDNAGLDKEVIPYTTRHTFITRLIEAGIPDSVVILYSGHTTTAMLKKYAHPKCSVLDLKVLDRKPKIRGSQIVNQAVSQA